MTHDSRNLVIEQCLPRIRLIARRFTYRLPPGVDVDDLVNEACMRMARRLDEGGTWSWMRAQGMMQEFLREHHQDRRAAMPLDVISRAANPEQLAMKSNAQRVVQRNAAHLTAREQAVLHLASHGISGRRAAQQLRVGDRHARKLKRAALSHLALLAA